MIDVREAFDFKFEQLIIRYKSFKFKYENFGFNTESESRINLGRPGVIILLGKNGAGKSRFLNGLKVFGEKNLELTPQISLRYSVPTIEEHLEYLDAKKNLMQSSEFSEGRDERERRFYNNGENGDTYEKEKLNLPFHDLIINSIVTPIINVSFRNSLGVNSFGDESNSEAVLKFFNFPQSEISAFRKRMEDHLNSSQFTLPFDMYFDEVRENLNFRDYFAEFFLAMISDSFVHKDDVPPGDGSYFNCTEFLLDSQERVLLVTGLRELFEGTSHVELICKDGNIYVSLTNNGVYGDELSKLLHKFGKLRNDHDNLCFPYDLLRNQSSPSSKWLKTYGNYRWNPFSVLDLTFQKRKESIEGLKKIFTSFVKMKIDKTDGPNYAVGVSGLEELDFFLDQVNRLLSRVEIGISKIERKSPEYLFVKIDPHIRALSENDPRIRRPDLEDHDFTPIVGWQDSVSSAWLPLDSCSDGQLDVLRILVNLCNFIRTTSTDGAKFLLIDEFDRHLHPVVSQQLLNLLDQYAKKHSTYVIVSTHSIGSLALHTHTQLFARQEFDGFFYLSTGHQDDPKVLAHNLGVPELDVRKLAKLFVLVEGDHEEIIFETLFSSNFANKVEVELRNMKGLYGLGSTWDATYQHENAPVLIVYDKRNEELETAWFEIQQKRKKAKIVENLWKNSKIDQMLTKCDQRKNSGKSISGDTELRTMAYLMKSILTQNENQNKNIQRLYVHGIEVPDIVDCLPISAFPKTQPFSNWNKLREANSELKPTDFKREFGISNTSVEKAVKESSSDLIHPELQRLWARVSGIIEIPEDWPTN